MTDPDREYLRKLIEAGEVTSPCLELGAQYAQLTLRDDIIARGIAYIGTDLVQGPNVNVIADFGGSPAVIQTLFAPYLPFGTVVIANVLEHTFNPIQVLDNAFSILRPGGVCITVTPAVWPLHGFPQDYWRINPNFYRRYASERGVHLLEKYFEFIGKGSIATLDDVTLPNPATNRFQFWKSKIVHRVFNTCGRSMMFPSHVAIGAVFQKPNTTTLQE
jgi:SAM-dependent methyltransferase